MEWQLECDRVGRSFGHNLVLRDVSFRLRGGQLAALYGPNGAGKSTLMRVLAGALKPTTGRALVGGAAAGSAEARRQTGFLAHSSMLHPRLTVYENLVFYGRLYNLPEPPVAADEILRQLHGLALGPRRVSELSQGMRQKAALARCLLHCPKLVLLDEPFASLDRTTVEEMRHSLATLRDGGLCLIVSSHNPAQVEDLASCSLLMERGRLQVGRHV